ncbi:MAG: hypothetical protein AAB215_08105 [Planctomycetota bacterium]
MAETPKKKKDLAPAAKPAAKPADKPEGFDLGFLDPFSPAAEVKAPVSAPKAEPAGEPTDSAFVEDRRGLPGEKRPVPDKPAAPPPPVPEKTAVAPAPSAGTETGTDLDFLNPFKNFKEDVEEKGASIPPKAEPTGEKTGATLVEARRPAGAGKPDPGKPAPPKDAEERTDAVAARKAPAPPPPALAKPAPGSVSLDADVEKTWKSGPLTREVPFKAFGGTETNAGLTEISLDRPTNSQGETAELATGVFNTPELGSGEDTRKFHDEVRGALDALDTAPPAGAASEATAGVGADQEATPMPRDFPTMPLPPAAGATRPPAPPDFLRTSAPAAARKSPILPIAAAAVLVIGAGLYFFVLRGNSNKTDPSKGKGTNITKKDPSKGGISKVEPVKPPVEPVKPPVEPVKPPVEPVKPPVEPVTPPVEPMVAEDPKALKDFMTALQEATVSLFRSMETEEVGSAEGRLGWVKSDMSTVEMRNGEYLVGTILSQNASEVVIRAQEGKQAGKLYIPMGQVKDIHKNLIRGAGAAGGVGTIPCTIFLLNGSTIRGDLIEATDARVVVKTAAGEMQLSRTQIKELQGATGQPIKFTESGGIPKRYLPPPKEVVLQDGLERPVAGFGVRIPAGTRTVRQRPDLLEARAERLPVSIVVLRGANVRQALSQQIVDFKEVLEAGEWRLLTSSAKPFNVGANEGTTLDIGANAGNKGCALSLLRLGNETCAVLVGTPSSREWTSYARALAEAVAKSIQIGEPGDGN